jgi:hypothetical protein
VSDFVKRGGDLSSCVKLKKLLTLAIVRGCQHPRFLPAGKNLPPPGRDGFSTSNAVRRAFFQVSLFAECVESIGKVWHDKVTSKGIRWAGAGRGEAGFFVFSGLFRAKKGRRPTTSPRRFVVFDAYSELKSPTTRGRPGGGADTSDTFTTKKGSDGK